MSYELHDYYPRFGFFGHGGPYNGSLEEVIQQAISRLAGDRSAGMVIIVDRETNKVAAHADRVGDEIVAGLGKPFNLR